MRRAGRNQEAYQRVLNESEETKLYLGYSWLDHLVHLGKKEEALKFYESYKEYAVQKWGDEAVKWGDLELCERAIDRLTQHNPNDPDRGTTPRQ